MRRIRNSFFFAVLLFVIFFICIGSFSADKKRDDVFVLRSLKASDIFEIKPYVSEDTVYFFIPSGFKNADLDFCCDQKVTIGDECLDGKSLSDYEFNKSYPIFYDGKERNMVIIGSGSVPTLYIDLLRSDKNYLNSDKNHVLYISGHLIDENGLNAADLKGTIKGRGNHSWNLNKKAYNLNLDQKTDLLSMGAAEKWALVSNAMDLSSLRNKTVYDFASRVGMQWTPEGQYVNLYIDGEYNGLYLLCEKVEVDEERLDIGNDGVLLKRELPERLDLVDNGFLTANKNVIEITHPKRISSFHKEKVEKRVQEMEDAILDLSSDRWKEQIDMDSWVKCYLIDELFDNFDSGIASAYFYYSGDGKVYRGPVWDYDAIMFDDPVSIVANTHNRQPYSLNDYYYYLYQREDFKNRAIEIYNSEFLPLIREMVSKTIKEESKYIDDARVMDSIRWTYSYSEEGSFEDFLDQRSRFLKEYWENEEDYCKVQIQKETFYLSFVVKKGATIDTAHGIDMSLFSENEYRYTETDRIFDISDVIEGDIRLDFVSGEKQESVELSPIARFGTLNIVFLFLFVSSFIFVLFRSYRKYHG